MFFGLHAEVRRIGESDKASKEAGWLAWLRLDFGSINHRPRFLGGLSVAKAWGHFCLVVKAILIEDIFPHATLTG